MAANALEQIIAHLQKLCGYEIDREGDLILASGSSNIKSDLLLRQNGRVIQFTARIDCNDNAKQDRAGFLEYINNLNNKANVARYCANKESVVFITAWHPYHYDHVAFYTFLEDLIEDCSESNFLASNYFGLTEKDLSKLHRDVQFTDLQTKPTEEELAKLLSDFRLTNH